MPWDFALILAVLGIVVPWRGAVRIRSLLARAELTTNDRLALYGNTIAFQWLAVGVVAWRCVARRVPFTELGLSTGDTTLTVGVALGLAALFAASQLFGLRRLARLAPERRGFLYRIATKLMPQNAVESLVFIALACTVAFCEEFLYRGFALAAIEHATSGSVPIAAVGSSALFALAHLYQGRRGLATTFIVGLIFCGARVATGSLLPSNLAHLLTDLLVGLWAPRLLRRQVNTGSALPVDATSVGAANRDHSQRAN